VKLKASKARQLANFITLSRAVIGLPVVLALSWGEISIAWILILIGGISDFIDGWLARMAGGGSDWGARLDPLADKILLAAPLVWLASKSILPIWAIWVIFTRELLVTGWRSDAPQGGPASRAGKAKTIMQFSSILMLLWPPNFLLHSELSKLGWWMFWPYLFLAVSSGTSYLKSQSKPYRQ